MKRFSIILLASLVVLFAVVPAFGQVTHVDSNDVAKLGKRINIGANPVLATGYPEDSLAVHPDYEVRAFDFPIAIRCADKNGKIVEGYVDKFEPLVVSVREDNATETVYAIHFVQRCGNPVYGRWVLVPKPLTPSPPGPEPPPAKVETPPPAPPPPGEPVVVTKKGRGIPWDAWFGVASSKSLESRAMDSYQGLYIDVYPIPVESFALKFAGATSQSNFDKFRGGVTHHRAYAGNMSRLQTGLAYRPWDSVHVIGLIGVQYDHKQDAWQPGPLLEGFVAYPLGPLWNEENATYQTGTEAFWFRTRHRVSVLTRGQSVWSIGGEFMRNSYQDNPTGRYYHYYTTRAHGFVHLDSRWLDGRQFTALAGIGRGSDSEHWGIIIEAGTRLW